MTVTVVFGKTSDGYLHSYDASYATSQAGPADAVNSGVSGYLGQNHNSGYQSFQTFIGFDYAAIPDTERVVHAAFRVYVSNFISPGTARDLEFRGYAWSTGGLLTSDWRTPAQLNAARDDGIVHLVSGVQDKYVWATTWDMKQAMQPVTTMEEVLVTNRQRQSITPTIDEGVAVSMADEAGTTFDPAMVYTSAPRSTLYGVLGAQVETSIGWAYIETNGAVTPTISLKHRTFGGSVTTIFSITPDDSTQAFPIPRSAQEYCLVADPSDNLFIITRAGGFSNSIMVKGFVKGSGETWSPTAQYVGGLPAFGQPVNNVAAAYHDIAGGTILVAAGHHGSAGDSVVHNEMAWATIRVPYVLSTGSGGLFRGSGYLVPSVLPSVTDTSHFNTWANEVGTGLDVASVGERGGDAAWGFVQSFTTGAIPGDNEVTKPGRYILSADGTSFSVSGPMTAGVSMWARKDAGGKIRAVPVSSNAVAYVTTDHDSGYGLTVRVLQYSGTNVEPVSLGGTWFAATYGNMPNGPAIAQTSMWDVIYNEIDNSLWLYFVPTTDAGIVRRTKFDLNTMNASGAVVTVLDLPGSAVVQSLRVQRNASVQLSTLLSVATLDGSTYGTSYVVDTFNFAPTAPTLTPKANFDATTAQTFAWTFSDPNAGDTQSAYQLEISRVSDGVVALDTGKVVSATSSRNVAGGTIANGVDYRWRVRTYDVADAVSPWSTYGLFTTSAGGTVTITVPAIDFPPSVITDDLAISWSVSGTTQSAYRVWLYRGSTLVSDTNWIASTATTHTVTGMLSDQNHEIRVQVRNAALVTTNTASRFVVPSFATPEVPLVTLTAHAEEGYILLTVDNPVPGGPPLGTTEESFESGLGTWSVAGGTAVQDLTVAHAGSASAKLTVSGSPSQLTYRDFGHFVPVVQGNRYTARMWVRCPVLPGAGGVSATLSWHNAAGTFVTSSNQFFALAADTWTFISVTGTVPTGTGITQATFGPTIGSSPANGTILYLDEIAMTVATDRPDVAFNEVLRRRSGSTGTWEIIGTMDADGSFRDYTATAGITYEYRARGEA